MVAETDINSIFVRSGKKCYGEFIEPDFIVIDPSFLWILPLDALLLFPYTGWSLFDLDVACFPDAWTTQPH